MNTWELCVYTDGTWLAGYGAWAFVVQSDIDPHVLDFGTGAGVAPSHQPMELTAALEAARWLNANASTSNAKILSDSKNYLVKCFDEKWHIRWKQSDPWRGSGRRKVKYVELWKSLFATLSELDRVHRVDLVQGHKGVTGNEQAHALCRIALRATHPEAEYRWTWHQVESHVRRVFNAEGIEVSDAILNCLKRLPRECVGREEPF